MDGNSTTTGAWRTTTGGNSDGAANGPDGGELKADYSAWRDRMRKKAEERKRRFEPEPAEPEPTGSYWDPEALFTGPEEKSPTEAALAVLDLRENATAEEIGAAFRNLAKVHHPDRWAGADAETRQHHEDCMRAVNEAYHALRAIDRT